MLGQHHVGRKIRVVRAQRKAEPGAQAGHGHGGRAGVHGQRGLKMLDDVGVQRPQHAQLVGDVRQIGKELAQHQTRLPAGAELKRRAEQEAAAKLTAMIRRELGLGIEGVDVRESARQKDEDQPIGPRRKMARPGRQRPAAIGGRSQRQPRVQARAAGQQSGRRLGEKCTTIERAAGVHCDCRSTLRKVSRTFSCLN